MLWVTNELGDNGCTIRLLVLELSVELSITELQLESVREDLSVQPEKTDSGARDVSPLSGLMGNGTYVLMHSIVLRLKIRDLRRIRSLGFELCWCLATHALRTPTL